MLEQTRAQGYALRSKDVRPVSNTLAVPVFENGHVMASIGLTWFSSAMDTDAAVSTYLPRMQQAARDIESRLNAMGVGASPAASRVAADASSSYVRSRAPSRASARPPATDGARPCT